MPKRRSSSGAWPRSNWPRLLRAAAGLLEGVGATREQWRFGGGTALAVVLGHRVSYDIDVFLTDPQLLPRLSPRLNDAATGLAKDYAESGDSLKMVLDDGDIDFIVRPCLLDAKPW
ncbi:MAG: nucleotidyl transferase AbiEii/AbiGii toxin family protein, partial [Alphaproteobacteria bacterium]|nr:nucleotidyl transferase AbiEii/AbiGii toxin family protein [Alphaproteobacteria bacterium]